MYVNGGDLMLQIQRASKFNETHVKFYAAENICIGVSKPKKNRVSET